MKNVLLSHEGFKKDTGLLLLRAGAGSIMLFSHGLPKLMKALGEDPTFFSLFGLSPEISLWLAIFAELACSVFLVLGLYTRLSLLPLIFTMAIAAFVAHGGDPFGKKEASLVFMLIFLALFFTGPGSYSIDAYRNKK